MSMVSRAGLVGVALVVLCGLVAAGAAGRQPPAGTAMYVVRHDPRLCPSPLCGGYWVAIANGARTRCVDDLRRPRCYVAGAVQADGGMVGDIAEEALVRGAMVVGDDLGELVVSAVYEPVGRAAPSGGFYRVTDTGIRCVRAPCFSYRVGQVNGATRTTVSSLDLEAAEVTPKVVARALDALGTKNGLYARGRFAPTPDGGRVFRVLRLYLRAMPPRA
jgi:Domain of unknown function (DUF6748)